MTLTRLGSAPRAGGAVAHPPYFSRPLHRSARTTAAAVEPIPVSLGILHGLALRLYTELATQRPESSFLLGAGEPLCSTAQTERLHDRRPHLHRHESRRRVAGQQLSQHPARQAALGDQLAVDIRPPASGANGVCHAAKMNRQAPGDKRRAQAGPVSGSAWFRVGS